MMTIRFERPEPATSIIPPDPRATNRVPWSRIRSRLDSLRWVELLRNPSAHAGWVSQELNHPTGSEETIMLRSALWALAALSLLAAPVAAQSNYPSRTVRIVVPATPGGGSDLFARLAAQHLASVLGQQFVVDNKPGGG